MTREITHMKAFSAALEGLEKKPFAIGMLQPTPGIVDEYFNGSTGDGSEVLARVVNDMIRAKREDHLLVARTAHACHGSAQHLGNLHGKRAHATGSAVD